MAAPNIVNVGTITGKTDLTALSSTQIIKVVENPASSGKVIKVNMIQVANVDGTNACDVTVKIYDSATPATGTGYSLVSTASVAADSSLVVLDKNTAVYLEEDHSITAQAGTANDLEVIVSYEEIS